MQDYKKYLSRSSVLLIVNDPVLLIMKKFQVEALGYNCVLLESLEDIDEKISNEVFDIIISYVYIDGVCSFNVFESIKLSCPIIFLAENPEIEWIDRLHKIPFSAICEEPVRSFTLLSTIIRLKKEIRIRPTALQSKSIIKVSNGYATTKEILLRDIVWLKVEGAYTTIYLEKTKYVQRTSLKKLRSSLDERFLQIHHSIVINTDFNFTIQPEKDLIELDGQSLKISRSFRRKVMHYFKNR